VRVVEHLLVCGRSPRGAPSGPSAWVQPERPSAALSSSVYDHVLERHVYPSAAGCGKNVSPKIQTE
jgi:hypothetical protein